MKSKILFLIGKGGVGKSTVSSFYALEHSKTMKVLLVSLDSAHNLHDIFEESLSDKPKKIKENLYISEINVEKKIEEYLIGVENNLKKSNTNLSAFNLLDEFNIIKQSPGLEEYALLKAFIDITEQHTEMNSIIFDMPPTALTLKFFSLPNRSLLWIEKLIDLRNRIKEKKKIVSNIKLGGKNIEKDRILENLTKQKQQYEFVNEKLKSENTGINLVLNQDILSINEGVNIVNEINKFGYSVSNVIINKVTEKIDNFPNFKNYTQYIIPLSKTKLIGLDDLERFLKINENLQF